ncbi:DUF4062 domain-containing protein [Clostridiales bacterium FE2010]|nr:DUF4062 domain-containing protein [Clostridiales bacterium FE2010]
MSKKYQIFISSTYEDLREERDKVRDAILSMYHFPVGMELFGAASEEQWEIIKETIDTSDYYILIVGQRYGTVIPEGPDKGISYTEKEFRYAKEKGIPILAFLIDDSVPVKAAYVEKKHNKEFNKFKATVKSGRTVSWWKNSDELAQQVTAALHKAMERKPGLGWTRKSAYQDETDEIDMIRILMSEKKELTDNFIMVKDEKSKLINELKKCKEELEKYEHENIRLTVDLQKMEEHEKEMQKALLARRQYKKYEGRWIQYNKGTKWPFIICTLLYKDGYYFIRGIGFDVNGKEKELYMADVINHIHLHIVTNRDDKSLCYIIRKNDSMRRICGFGELGFHDTSETNAYDASGYYYVSADDEMSTVELKMNSFVDYKMVKYDKYLYERLKRAGNKETFGEFINKGIFGIWKTVDKYKDACFFG